MSLSKYISNFLGINNKLVKLICSSTAVLSFIYSIKVRCIIMYILGSPIPLLLTIYYILKKYIDEYKIESKKENFNILNYIKTKLFSYKTIKLLLLFTSNYWFPSLVKKQNEIGTSLLSKLKLPFELSKWMTWIPFLEWNKVKLINDINNPPKIENDMINFNLALPHGVIPYLQTIGIGKTYGEKFLYHLVAGIFFKIPIVSTLLDNFGGMAAKNISKGNVLDTMTNPEYKGKIASLFPGGIADQDLTEPCINGINLCNHKGFLKLCLEQGANLNISYFFNTENMYSKFISVLIRCVFFFLPTFYQNKIRTMIYFLLPIHNRVPITGVFSHFERVEKKENVSEEDIDNLYNKLNEFTYNLVSEYNNIYSESPLISIK